MSGALDLGIFSGHELPYLLTMVGESGTLHAVDPIGLDLLSEYTREFAETCQDRLRSVCRVNEEGPRAWSRCTVQPLDDYVDESRLEALSFIKIDIEGMERESLLGLSRTLKRARPTLSLAIYDTPESLWGLPLKLMNELDGYEFYVDHCSPIRWETILTAVPKERSFNR